MVNPTILAEYLFHAWLAFSLVVYSKYMYVNSPLREWEGNWNLDISRNCFWDRWTRRSAIGISQLLLVPEVFAKVNSAQFPPQLFSGEWEICNRRKNQDQSSVIRNNSYLPLQEWQSLSFGPLHDSQVA